MAELHPHSVNVRDEDEVVLIELAEKQRRTPDQQAGWMLEQAIKTYQRQTDPNGKPRKGRGGSRNGLTHQVAAGIS